MQTNMNVEHIYILYQKFLRLSLRFASFSSIFLLSFIYCSNEVCSICLKVLSSKSETINQTCAIYLHVIREINCFS